jgi:hypothetical protein
MQISVDVDVNGFRDISVEVDVNGFKDISVDVDVNGFRDISVDRCNRCNRVSSCCLFVVRDRGAW